MGIRDFPNIYSPAYADICNRWIMLKMLTLQLWCFDYSAFAVESENARYFPKMSLLSLTEITSNVRYLAVFSAPRIMQQSRIFVIGTKLFKCHTVEHSPRNISRSLSTTLHLRESNGGVYSSHNFRRRTNLGCTLPFPFGTIFHPFLRVVALWDIHITAVFLTCFEVAVPSRTRASADLARILHPSCFFAVVSRVSLKFVDRSIGRTIRERELITYNLSRTSIRMDGIDFHRAEKITGKGAEMEKMRRRRGWSISSRGEGWNLQNSRYHLPEGEQKGTNVVVVARRWL